jgi:hypothetical protein
MCCTTLLICDGCRLNESRLHLRQCVGQSAGAPFFGRQIRETVVLAESITYN